MRSSWALEVRELGAREEFGLDFMLIAVVAAVDAAAELSTAITLDTPDPMLDTLRREPGALRCSLDTLFGKNCVSITLTMILDHDHIKNM